MTDWIDFLIPALIGLTLLLLGVAILRSNASNRVVWKFPVGWFAIVLGVVFGISASLLFPTEAVQDVFASDSTTTTSTIPTTSSSTTTTQFVSDYAVPSLWAAQTWARDAITYAESQDFEWDDSAIAIEFWAGYATRRCAELAGAPIEKLPISDNPWAGFRPNNQPAVPATPAQVEANMRQTLGIEGWEYFGAAWYDSLANGLCVR